MREDFAVLILTNARPDRVVTYRTLKRKGYTGKIYLVIDDLDSSKDDYINIYGHQVLVFNKKEAAKITDAGDNSTSLKGVVYARNAAFGIAKDLGLSYFLVLDDDYGDFSFRFNQSLAYAPKTLGNLDEIFTIFLEFLIRSGANSIALSQGGDYIGGEESSNAQAVRLTRKVMNSFFCSVDRPFKFHGRINEDTTMYVDDGARGKLYFTTNQISLGQGVTQANAGGLTEIYLESGTYVKSFYSVMYQPSSVKVRMLSSKYSRLHHGVNWKCTVPKILSEDFKKV